DIALKLVGRCACQGKIEIPARNSVVQKFGAHAEMLEGFVLDAAADRDAIIQAAGLGEALRRNQVEHAAIPRDQGHAASAVDHDVAYDPAEPRAQAVDAVNVHLAGSAG